MDASFSSGELELQAELMIMEKQQQYYNGWQWQNSSPCKEMFACERQYSVHAKAYVFGQLPSRRQVFSHDFRLSSASFRWLGSHQWQWRLRGFQWMAKN
jgi:hypothetical protein